MKRKLESDEELDTEVCSGDVDEFRDQILEQELEKNEESCASDDVVSVIKPCGKEPNLSLPQDWMGLYHTCGGIIYLNRKTRVCTWARPYHIGQASVRKHDVPTVAIPCLHQIMALERDKEERPLDTHDGAIGHHAGNLDNHCGNHGSHLGNEGNQEEDFAKNTDEQHRESGADITLDDHANKDGYNDNIDGDHDHIEGGQHGDGIDDGNNYASHSNTDGSGTDSSHVLTKVNIDTINSGIPHNAVTRNTRSCSIKMMENGDSDSNSDSGIVCNLETSKPTCQLEMSSALDITNYLGKLWQFHEISKEESRKLVLTDSTAPPRDPSQEYKSTEILKTIPYLVQGTNPNSKNNEKVCINPAGKSARSLLHEYCLKVLKVKAEYTTKESGVPKTPFLAIVHVDGLEYGTGMAANKKQAKHLAAQRTLEILLPEFRKLVDVEEHLKIFDTIPIEDPNVYELTSKVGLLSPYQVLNECIKRNQGVLSSELKFELNHGADKKLYYTMECGKHKASGTCRNKKIGRELASQALLQKLHPHLKFWGLVLRIYVDEHTAQEFTKPEAPVPVRSSTVNKELLCDLKQEMWNLMKRKKSTPTTSSFSKSFTEIAI